MEETLLSAALCYHRLGLNVVCIQRSAKAYKFPDHAWEHLEHRRQSAEELGDYNWEGAAGLGIVLGHSDLVALSFNFCWCSQCFINDLVLDTLGLPRYYEWTYLSNIGYHLVFRCDYAARDISYAPGHAYRYAFERLDLRTCGHLIVPPSRFVDSPPRRPEYQKELFLYSVFGVDDYIYPTEELPQMPPAKVDRVKLGKVLETFSQKDELDFWEFCEMFPQSDNWEPVAVQMPLTKLFYNTSSLDVAQPHYVAENLELTATHADKDRSKVKVFLFFDTETTGLPRSWSAPSHDLSNWPRAIQIAWIGCDETGNVIERQSYIVKPDGFEIPEESAKVHGISTETALLKGSQADHVLEKFAISASRAHFVICHNLSFDEPVISAEYLRRGLPIPFPDAAHRICTMKSLASYVNIPGRYGEPKWPTLQELHRKLYGGSFEGAHDAIADVEATVRCFWRAKDLGLIKVIDA